MWFGNIACPTMLYEFCNIFLHLWLKEIIMDTNKCFISSEMSTKSIVVSLKNNFFPQRTLRNTQTIFFEKINL
jgi:hypothetical protein